MSNGQYRIENHPIRDIDLDTIQVLQLAVYIILNDTVPASSGISITAVHLSGSIDHYVLFDACTREFTSECVAIGVKASFKPRRALESDPAHENLSKHIKFKNLHTFNFDTDANAAKLRQSLRQLFLSSQDQFGRFVSSDLYEFVDYMSQFLGELHEHANLPSKARDDMLVWLRQSLPPAPIRAPTTASSSSSPNADHLHPLSLQYPSSSCTQATPANIQPTDNPTLLPISSPQPIVDLTLLSTSSGDSASSPAPNSPSADATSALSSVALFPPVDPSMVIIERKANLGVDTVDSICFEAYWIPHLTTVGVRIKVERHTGSQDYYYSQAASWFSSWYSNGPSCQEFPLSRVDSRFYAFDDNTIGSVVPIAQHDFTEDARAADTRNKLETLLKSFNPVNSARIAEHGNFVDAICSFANALMREVGIHSAAFSMLEARLNDLYLREFGFATPMVPSKSLTSSSSSSGSSPVASNTTISRYSAYLPPLIGGSLLDVNLAGVTSIVAIMFRLDDPIPPSLSELLGIRFEIFFKDEFPRFFVHYLDREAKPMHQREIATTEVRRSHPSGTTAITQVLFVDVYDDNDPLPIKKFANVLKTAGVPHQSLIDKLTHIAGEFCLAGFYADPELVGSFLARLAELDPPSLSVPKEQLSRWWKTTLAGMIVEVDEIKQLAPLTARTVGLYFGPKISILIQIMVQLSIVAWETLKPFLEDFWPQFNLKIQFWTPLINRCLNGA